MMSSPGARGFTPWLDLERELAGIFMVDGVNQRIRDDVAKIVAWSRDEFALRGAACFGMETQLGGNRLRLLPERECVAGNGGFSLLLSGAPAGAPGLTLFGFEHAGLELLGIRFHVDLATPPVAVVVTADRNGQARLQVPLPGSARGATAAAQGLWFWNRFGATPGLRLMPR